MESAKRFGWFSRRHQTSEAYEKYARDKESKVLRSIKTIEENKKARASRTNEQQLALLDERLGVGVGAKKERARLSKLIEKDSAKKAAEKSK